MYSVANYVAMYPPFPNPDKHVPKTEKQLKSIAQEVAEKKLRYHPHANAITQWLAPRKMQKFIEHCPSNDKYFSVWDDYISCGLCAKVCPCHNIRFENGKPIFLHQCSQCMVCISFCPKQAINFPRFTRKRKNNTIHMSQLRMLLQIESNIRHNSSYLTACNFQIACFFNT